MRPLRRAAPSAGFSTLELLVAATVGLLVAGAALSLCGAGNRAVARLAASQAAWQEVRAAALLWGTEWRGAGYDPTGDAGAGVTRARPESLEFAADWNGDGALGPTLANPNERLAHALAPGAWRRGVNGGPRLPAAWPDSARFRLLDGSGRDLGSSPPPPSVRVVEARIVLTPAGVARPVRMGWTVARRNVPQP